MRLRHLFTSFFWLAIAARMPPALAATPEEGVSAQVEVLGERDQAPTMGSLEGVDPVAAPGAPSNIAASSAPGSGVGETSAAALTRPIEADANGHSPAASAAGPSEADAGSDAGRGESAVEAPMSSSALPAPKAQGPGLLLPARNLSIDLPIEAPVTLPAVAEQAIAEAAPAPPGEEKALPELRFEPQRFPPLEHPAEVEPAPVEAAGEGEPDQRLAPSTPTRARGSVAGPLPVPVKAVPAAPRAPACPAIPGDETLTLDLLLFGKIQGDFAFIDCRDLTGERDLFAYASQVALVKTVGGVARRQERLDPLSFNLGDSTFPGAFANFLFSQGEAGATELATVLAKIPYDGMSLGNHDFAPPRDEALRFFQAAHRAHLPFLGANLRCETPETEASLCALLGTSAGGRPYRFVRRGPLNIGITALIDPKITDQLAKDRFEGLAIDEPRAVLKKLISEMRANGANFIIVLFHLAAGQTTNVLEPLIDEIEGLDLVITDRLFAIDEEPLAANIPALRQMGHMVLPRTHTFVLGTGSSAHSATRATLRIRQEGARFRIEQLNPRYISTGILDPDPETAHRLKGAAEAFCEEWGGPLRPGTELAQAFDIFDMAEFVLNTLRFTADAELAFMNARAFRNPEQFPLLDTLTQADVFSTLPFGSQLITVSMPGSEIDKLAAHLGGEVLGVGLVRNRKGDLEVNGRPLDKKRSYRVALNEFLAEGSGGFLNPKKLQDAAPYRDPVTGKAPTLARLVSDAVKRGRFDAPDGTSRLSPRDSFPDLHRRPLWKVGGSLNAAYSQVTIANPKNAEGEGVYDKSRLTAAASDVLNIELKALASASSRDHGWDSDFLLQYATTRMKGESESNVFEETKDVLRLRSAYKYFGLRSALGSRWFVPVPYSEVQIESQLTRQADSAWHPWELTGIVGLLLKLTSTLEFKMGFNLRGDPNAPDESPMVGLFTGYQLVKTSFFEIARRPLQFESEFEYFFNANGTDQIHEFRWANKLFFTITGHLSLTANFNMYLYKTKVVGEVGRAIEAMIGLNVALEKMIQTF